MRLDSRLQRDELTERQLFFVECWASLSHKNNIDSDRVTFNNPLNSINELLELYEHQDRFNAPQKRLLIMSEFLDLIVSDTVLKSSKFEGIPENIKSICSPDNKINDLNSSPLEKRRKLIISLLKNLKELLVQHYRNEAFRALSSILEGGTQLSSEEKDDIYFITNSIISVLLSLGMPLAECYLLYRNFLQSINSTPDQNKKGYDNFGEAFEAFRQKLTMPKQEYKVTLRLESQRLHNLLMRHGGNSSISFQNCELLPIPHFKKNKVAANIAVSAISEMAARRCSEEELFNAIDVISYMMKSPRIEVEKEYQAGPINGPMKKLTDFEEPLVNQVDQALHQDLHKFVSTVSGFYNGTNDNVRRRMSSVFRFIKTAFESDEISDRFISFWSSLESITIGVSEREISHDQQVIYSVIPCVALSYPVKQLLSVKILAKDLNWEPVEFDGSELDLKTCGFTELYSALKDENITRDLISRLDQYPYAQYRFNRFFEVCKEPYTLAKKIQSHIGKVEQQIHRIYRTRNALVHNAHTTDRLELLTVNLEHYLRSTINSMVAIMESSSTIEQPSEALVRYRFMFEEILGEMDPSFLLTNFNKKEGKRKEIGNTVHPTDFKLKEWLSTLD